MQLPKEDRGESSKDQVFQLFVKMYGGILYSQIRKITRNHEQIRINYVIEHR